ncbi:metallophosphoesterase [Balneolaceae bacterium ANBcel3]|nr:metallophosphoesterase [Balneolaceae bacterium ANBcel3]
MKIGVLSDTHDHVKNITRAVSLFRSQDVQHLFHAGDFCSPFTIPLFKGYRMDAVFGNNDGDHFRLAEKFRENGLSLHNEFFETEIEGVRVALYHGTQPAIRDALVACGTYDLVITGHTHQVVNEVRGKTRVLNPGSAHGFESQPTVAIFDTETREATILTL